MNKEGLLLKRKRFLMIVMAFVFGMIAACTSENNAKENENAAANGETEDENFNEKGFPIVDEPIKLEFMTDKAPTTAEDRKSTRLNSSHVSISYAVFCLKKKKKQTLR